jgi:hypothetical protein
MVIQTSSDPDWNEMNRPDSMGCEALSQPAVRIGPSPSKEPTDPRRMYASNSANSLFGGRR